MNQPSPPAPASPADGRRADLLSPYELAATGGMEFTTRKIVEGFLLGLHRSPHRGFSAEFAEHRAYQPGDDLRYLDWRMYARSDRFYVKQFEEETNLRAYLLLDVSESMRWSSHPELVSKLWYAKQLAAAIGLILVRQGDALGLSVFHDQVVHHMRARGGRRQWHQMLRTLHGLQGGGGTAAADALRQIARRLTRAGLVVLISDLLVEPNETRRVLQFLQHRGHLVLVLHVMDPGERELPTAGEASFKDPETGEEMRVNAADLREAYRIAVDEALHEWLYGLRPHGVDYATIWTDEPFHKGLRLFFQKRGRIG